MFIQRTLTIALLVALVAALPQPQQGQVNTCPNNIGLTNILNGPEAGSYCCPGTMVATSISDAYCCVGGQIEIPTITFCPGFPFCSGGTAVAGTVPTSSMVCQTTVAVNDPNYNSIINAIVSGTTINPITSTASALSTPSASATNGDDQTTSATAQSTTATASSSSSKGAGAQMTALPMAGALMMAAGGLVVAAL